MSHRIDLQLKEIECTKGIPVRPTRDSDLYKDMQYSVALKQTKKIKKKIAVVARERWFLLNLKAKFAGKCRTLKLQ